MGFVTAEEAARSGWMEWLGELRAAGRVVLEGDHWYATEATRDPKLVLRGRMEALGPVHSDNPLLLELEAEGAVLRTQWQGRTAWCDRRLLARIQRRTLDRLRREIRPVPAATYLRFLADWQLLSEERRGAGPGGVSEVARVLAGYEAPIPRLEKDLIARRVRDYKPEWLDELGLSGQLAWARLWGGSRLSLRSTPVAVFPREEAASWLALAAPPPELELCWPARAIRGELEHRGALFTSDLVGKHEMLGYDVDRGLGELVSAGLVASDSFASLRRMLAPPHRWKRLPAVGRWFLLERGVGTPPGPDFVVRALLRRWGVVFRAVLERERLPLPWRDLLRSLRALELSGEVRGGRFVDRFAGEQYALPEAIPRLRAVARADEKAPLQVAAADPLNLRGILTPEERVASNSRSVVSIV
jgi:ATP-dependent Lhr-like helicase